MHASSMLRISNINYTILSFIQKFLKIPKGKAESVNLRRTDNIMAKRKLTKGQTTIYKTLHRKLKTEQHKPH
jgi:hypothetical protein